ncbi:MAG: phosphoribosylformylglycinamidine cyclo-ligase [Actinobacteria bacterium]|nr:phosphoribosylformylglycinamidine cyclo-ligase [Actinomycetota bacterium]MCI0678868.1 phosphoribosylformylglycinamidine cyclo-ligase [Actinomycetota bacterium]
MTSYRAAGVDVEAAERHVRRITDTVVSTWTEEVIGGFGGFAAGVRLPSGYRRPVLMLTTDGVGTKLELARRSGLWDGVGRDLVAMCVDDLAVVGARPLGLVDYMAVGALDAERDARIVASVAQACAEAGCPLLGGETAVHPDVMEPDSIDLAGAALGVVEEDAMPGADRVTAGDLVIGLHSPNLRSNGFSLVRRVFGEAIDEQIDELLQSSVLYSPAVLTAMAGGGVKAAAHVTGGGIVANLRRSIPSGLGALIDVKTWRPPPIFDLVADMGVEPDEMYATFNMGIGFCLIVAPDSADEVMTNVGGHGPSVIGKVDGTGVVRLG